MRHISEQIVLWTWHTVKQAYYRIGHCTANYIQLNRKPTGCVRREALIYLWKLYKVCNLETRNIAKSTFIKYTNGVSAWMNNLGGHTLSRHETFVKTFLLYFDVYQVKRHIERDKCIARLNFVHEKLIGLTGKWALQSNGWWFHERDRFLDERDWN